jgi:hypothetical protein
MNKNIFKTLLVVLFFCAIPLDAHHPLEAPSLVEAQAPYVKEKKDDVKLPEDYTLDDAIDKFSREYSIPREWLVNLAKCESSFGKRLVGDNGNAYGQYQYWEPTWVEFEKRIGQDLDKFSLYDQTKMTAFALDNNLGHRWSCNYLTGKVK